MKLAFVDLVFAWPPPGGAQADLYQTMLTLQALGHEVKLFGLEDQSAWRFGSFPSEGLPFPASSIAVDDASHDRDTMPRRIKDAVDAWKPDAVFLCFGRYLKPYVAEALAHYPVAARYYMYEPICIRDFTLFREGEPCPKNFLSTPDFCRRCASKCWRKDILSGQPTPYAREILAADAFSPEYHRRSLRALESFRSVIVYNRIAEARLDGFCKSIHVIPGGVRIDEFTYCPPKNTERSDRKIILMTGRANDPLKGFETLVEAGQALYNLRTDFEIWVTHGTSQVERPWLKDVGWMNHDGIMALYRQADICVVPSVWDEPFGIVAVEAMATGLPVCVTRVGGLQEIVTHGETGFLFDRESSAELALHLFHLLDDAALRERMGKAGRAVAEERYDWRRVVERHYPAVLEELAL